MRAFNHLRLRARETCRCCGDEDERFSHLSRCASIREVFDFFVIFASAFDGAIQMRAITIYLGLVTGQNDTAGGMECGTAVVAV